ncbi:MAG: hypothetical protein AB7N91_01095 [Candidatus Tectimicrobiota bacterium]
MHPFTIWLALAGSLWSLFAFAEDHLTAESRAGLTAWLRGHSADWPGSLAATWDSVLPTAPATVRGDLRACVMLYVTAFLLLGLSGVLYPGTGIMFLVFVLAAPLLFGLLALVNLLPGYLSLRVYRRLLQQAMARPSGAHPGPSWLGASLLVTAVLALLAWALSFLVVSLGGKAQLMRYPVTWISGYVDFVLQGGHGSLEALLEALQLRPVLVPGVAFPSFGIWLYTPCLPLVWSCLFLLAGALIRCTNRRGERPGMDDAGLLALEARPLRSLGAVAVGLMSALYWVTLYLRTS